MSTKRIVVAVRTEDVHRAAEALRAAVGLSLRGDRIDVVRLRPFDDGDARLRRCLSTLTALGHRIDAPRDALRGADAIEVWT